MELSIIALLVSFVFLLMLNVPIAIAIGVASELLMSLQTKALGKDVAV